MATATVDLVQVVAMLQSGHLWFVEKSGPEWQFVYLPASYWPLFSAPCELTDRLGTFLATTLADR